MSYMPQSPLQYCRGFLFCPKGAIISVLVAYVRQLNRDNNSLRNQRVILIPLAFPMGIVNGIWSEIEKRQGADKRMERPNPKRLQQIRENLGISREELSKKSGIKPSMIQKYELGFKDLHKAGYDTVKAYADAMGLDIETLMNENIVTVLKIENGHCVYTLNSDIFLIAQKIVNILQRDPSLNTDALFDLLKSRTFELLNEDVKNGTIK